jgi:predicted HD phosphohydrolase
MQTVQFTQMRDGTKAEYDLLHEMERHYIAALPDRILGALRALDDGLGGYRVSRLQHSLQAATRAERDGADSDWVVAALVHDTRRVGTGTTAARRRRHPPIRARR